MGIPAETLKQEVMPKVEENAEDKNNNKLNQPMHKNDRTKNIKDFVQNIYDKTDLVDENEMKQIGNKNLFLPKGVVTHDFRRHQLTPDEWQEVADNIDNIFIAKDTDEKNSYSENNYKIGISTSNNNYYGLVIGVNKNCYVCTAMKFNTKKGVKAFVDERGKKDKKKNLSMMPSNEPTAPISKNTKLVVTHSKGSDSIITYIKDNLNPNNENKGAYSPKENLIEFFKNADSSTSVHEVGHWILNTWNKYAPLNKEIEAD